MTVHKLLEKTNESQINQTKNLPKTSRIINYTFKKYRRRNIENF